MKTLDLVEWGAASAGTGEHPQLDGLFLDEPQLAEALRRFPSSNHLRLGECRHGLVVRAQQHVGVLRLGPLQVRIRPKMETGALWSAVTYALGLEGIRHQAPTDLAASGDFVDLLGLALLREAERLWRTGIQRGYVETTEWRSTVRGRPDLTTLARSGPLTKAQLPCRYHAYTADTVDNQLVLAGLALARRLVSTLSLRAALHRCHQQWSTACAEVPLRRGLFLEAGRGRTRLTERYAGAHRLVQLLYAGGGLDEEYEPGEQRIPGFLWNMATLFEAFVARFLTEHLPGHQVMTQERLRQLYRVVQKGPHLKAPKPRPDLVVRRRDDRQVLAVFDTKYRDLWATKLPRDMLYQLSVYAFAWGGQAKRPVPAIILYPEVGGRHPDQLLELRVGGAGTRRIILRAVDWGGAARHLEDRAHAMRLAERWVSLPDAA